MKKCNLVLYILFFLSSFIVHGQSINIIPYPNKVDMGNGHFLLNANTTLVMESADPAVLMSVDLLLEKIKKSTGYSLDVVGKVKPTNYISVKLSADINGLEGYDLTVSSTGISIKAKGAVGVFYAIQSLLQLMPAAIESELPVAKLNWLIPAVHITDSPAFKYRGLMLDVARHFMPVSFLKKLVDLMAMQKMNNLHLHLTDDQGWRIEIKKYPLLTSVGSKRNGTVIGKSPGEGSDNIPVAGFYSQEEIRDLVRYAQKKFINIIPEIELPGHASAAIAAYPALSCFPDSSSVTVPGMISTQSLQALNKRGTKIVQETWGVFQDVFCPTEFTFHFLEDVMDEITELFPSKFIHVGGDECPKESWKGAAFCQQLIREKGLKDEHALQSYFIQRIEKYLNTKGRSIIGWDEILEGGLAPNATVMSWRGESGGIEAAKQNHDVIMTPLDYCYFNLYQSSDPTDSIAWGGLLPLRKVYNYHPIPAVLNTQQAQSIIGVQGNLWSEFVKGSALAEYMLFPRAIALAELSWTTQKPGFDNFVNRLQPYLKRLDIKGASYSHHFCDLQLSAKYLADKKKLLVAVSGAGNNGRVYYSLRDVKEVVTGGILYKKPFYVDGDAKVTAAVLMNGKVADRTTGFFTINKATGQEAALDNPPTVPYNKAGKLAWINGVIGSDKRFNDDQWLGWNGGDFSGTLHFGKPEVLTSVSMRFFHSPSNWVYMPSKVSLYSSADGISFSEIAVQENFDNKKSGLQEVRFSLPSVRSKHLKITASNYGVIPKGNPGEGSPAWLFVDEVIVH